MIAAGRFPAMPRANAQVVHIITRLDVGGSTENTVISATRMPAEFACALISGRTRDPMPGIAEAIRAAGIPWVKVPTLQREVRPAADGVALVHLWWVLRRLRPDIVHVHSSKAGLLGRVAARLAGVRHIVYTPHGHVFHGYFGRRRTRLFVALERWAARFTDRIVTLTDAEAAQHLAVGIGRPEQFVTIPSGIALASDGAAGEDLRGRLRVTPRTPLVGAVSRLTPIKGLPYLIAAMPDLLRRCPEVHLVIGGDGEQRAELETQAARLGVRARVHFLGFLAEPARLLAALDVFVLPSLNEAQGRVLVQAMAVGRPVVATRVGGVPEILDNGRAGVLVPPAEPASLAEAISGLLLDRDRAAHLGLEARHRAALYGVDQMLKTLAEMYRELMGSGK
jgi:glycosyltransferase involved in cell wall biosynthesis